MKINSGALQERKQSKNAFLSYFDAYILKSNFVEERKIDLIVQEKERV